jgi:hypothetical protein
MRAFLIFDFGENEEAAQKARHRVDGWKQGFRLGDKIALQFERRDAEEAPAQTEGKKKAAPSEDGAHIRVAVLLHFSPHEKMSYQRWLERIPSEEPFKGVAHEVITEGDKSFEKTADWFESLSLSSAGSVSPAAQRKPR